MQVLVHLVHTWGQHKLAFAASTKTHVVVLIPTTRLDGVVGKFVEMYCLVVSTPAPDHVTKASVVLAKSASMRVATAARSRSRSCVVIEGTSTQARSCTSHMAVMRRKKNGQAYSNAAICAHVCSIADTMLAKSPVIHKKLNLDIAHAPQTSSVIALAGKHQSRNSRILHAYHARTRFPTVTSDAEKPSTVDTSASKSVTLENALHVCEKYKLTAVAGVQLQPPSATRA